MKSSRKDVVVLGAALFAMFFGAGNLIFPPAIGLSTGDQWVKGFLGFFITGIGLPILGVLAVAKAGGTITDLSKKVGKTFSFLFSTIIILAIGPLLAIPRTGATVYEIGVEPILKVNPILVSIIYFSITLFFVIKPSGIMDKVGKILTPILLLVISTIILTGIFMPISQPISTGIESAFSYGFVEGYQTMDALGAIVMGGIILATLIEKGYHQKKDQLRMTSKAGLIAGLTLTFIYGGLLYLGSTSAAMMDQDIERTQLMIQLTALLLGHNGLLILSVAVSAACLTTSIGLTAIVGQYFEKVSNGKLKYKYTVIGVCIFSAIMSVSGVETIVGIAVPLLLLLYPVAMVLIVLNLASGMIHHPFVYKGAAAGALIIGAIESLNHLSLNFLNPVIEPLYTLTLRLPLAQEGFAWILPCIFLGLLFPLVAPLTAKRTIKEEALQVAPSASNQS